MESEQLILLVINIVGGTAVLGSYVRGVRGHPETRGRTWGGVPASLKPFYTVSMLTAAAGYLVFGYFILFEIQPDEIEVLGNSGGYWVYYLICSCILIPSALWMPLTFKMIDRPSNVKWVVSDWSSDWLA